MRQRRAILVGFAVALFLGVAVYFRLWAIDRQDDSTATADDREALRSATVSSRLTSCRVIDIMKSTASMVHLSRTIPAYRGLVVGVPLSLAFPLLSHFNLIGKPRHHYQVPLRGLTYCKRYQLQHAASSSLSTTLCILLKFMSLFQETMNLQKQIESLKQQIEDKRRHCNCSRSSSQL
ncbi:hypothetical protein BHE74_00056040 [Ensete ventricosum]|nr:hypothetical protein BHE74_00056040 [Ensete ventricosum]